MRERSSRATFNVPFPARRLAPGPPRARCVTRAMCLCLEVSVHVQEPRARCACCTHKISCAGLPCSRLHLLPICDLRGVGSPGQGGPNHVSEVNESVKAWSRPGRASTAGRPPRLVGCYYVDQSKVRLTPVKRRQAFRSFSHPPPAGRHFSTIFPWPCSRCHCSTPSSS